MTDTNSVDALASANILKYTINNEYAYQRANFEAGVLVRRLGRQTNTVDIKSLLRLTEAMSKFIQEKNNNIRIPKKEVE